MENNIDNKLDEKIGIKRGEDQTYLTYPEWFLVFSPEEYANYLKYEKSYQFPFLTHIYQFWKSYFKIYKEVRKTYKFNTEYHIMIMTIGISTSIEYLVKSLYGNTIYRFIDFISSNRIEEEDLAYKINTDYVISIKDEPWYKFDFYSYLKPLWSIKIKSIKSIERKISISIELLIKHVYAKAIQKASEKSFEKPSMNTFVLVEKNNEKDLLKLTRYQKFTEEAIELVNNNNKILEIAGNKNFIMISLVVKSTNNNFDNIIYQDKISTNKNIKRILVKVNIDNLNEFIKINKKDIEHIFDF